MIVIVMMMNMLTTIVIIIMLFFCFHFCFYCYHYAMGVGKLVLDLGVGALRLAAPNAPSSVTHCALACALRSPPTRSRCARCPPAQRAVMRAARLILRCCGSLVAFLSQLRDEAQAQSGGGGEAGAGGSAVALGPLLRSRVAVMEPTAWLAPPMLSPRGDGGTL
jgi:hypothetical protein